jgi:hypothetical protein
MPRQSENTSENTSDNITGKSGVEKEVKKVSKDGKSKHEGVTNYCDQCDYKAAQKYHLSRNNPSMKECDMSVISATIKQLRRLI